MLKNVQNLNSQIVNTFFRYIVLDGQQRAFKIWSITWHYTICMNLFTFILRLFVYLKLVHITLLARLMLIFSLFSDKNDDTKFNNLRYLPSNFHPAITRLFNTLLNPLKCLDLTVYRLEIRT